MSTSDADRADLLLHGGAVYPVAGDRPWAEAVAVRAGRIVAVGSDRELRDWVGAATEVVDLDGALVLPGFQDAHVHPGEGGLTRQRCDLHDLGTRAEYLQAVRQYADGHPDVPWVLGGGWSMEAFPRGVPDKDVLDAVLPDRPAYLPNRDGHGAWVNTAALRLAGISRDTPDPADGRIERDSAGEPSGTLHEGAAALVGRHVPPPSPAELVAGLLAGQEYLHSLGITGWQDAIVGESTVGPDTFDAYCELDKSGQLTARVVGALWWRQDRDGDQIAELVHRRSSASGRRFRATSVKIMQDGVCENFTAGMTSPYLDAEGRQTANRGLSFVDPELLKGYVTRLDAEGFQVHFHAIGDRAVREALDAIEAARRANGMNDRRHHIAHIQVIHPADLGRFAELAVVANAQALWACDEPQMRELTLPFLGPERSGWQYPFAGLLRTGARLACGSDWPVSTPDPLAEMHVAVNRTPPGASDVEPFLPGQAITLAEAVHGFTMGSAYVNHVDDLTGSIEPGKYADLAVVDRNLFEHPAAEIADAKVVLTFVGGERVYDAAAG
ncbi:MAG TPA: amidohydrolase [Nocardioidaceae bacterium]|nr:amidohydrolase [Nocardioidaceae bacterium]